MNKDLELPLRSTCTDVENEACTPTRVTIPILTSGVIPANVTLFTASGKDYIRATGSSLNYWVKEGIHVMQLELSDASGCITKYSINLKVKNTQPIFSPSTPVITDFTLKMNEFKALDVK